MLSTSNLVRLLPSLALLLFAFNAQAQSFRVQCPAGTKLHPAILANDPTAVAAATAQHLVYDTITQLGRSDGKLNPTNAMSNPHIKCQQLSGGDGFATMGDGTQTYLFAFGPLSGLKDLVNGLPGTQPAPVFNQSNYDNGGNVLDVVKVGAPDGADYTFNGAIGLVPDAEGAGSGASLQAVVLDTSVDSIAVVAPGSGYDGTAKVWIAPPPCTPVVAGSACAQAVATATISGGQVAAVNVTNAGNGYTSPPPTTITGAAVFTGHVDPRLIMDVGVMNGNIPAPMIAIDEGDELFLTLTNVGMVMRPDLFEQHTVHFHGYPNASAFYDGVPDASVAINIGGSFTYYYLAPEAGTYMWHCHISPPEHLQMGMVGQIYVRPRQNTVTSGTLRMSAVAAQASIDTKCASADILCSTQVPAVDTGATGSSGKKYAFDDGDGTTAYDVEYPIQMHGFDPNFHFVGMTFNPESFVDNKDKYFLLNGRSYPDTVNPAPLSTQSSDGVSRFSQPLNSIVNIPAGGRALLRISDLNVTEYHTLASLGIPMHVVGYNARLLRDQDGNNMDYYTNSITLGGGESVDVILDACMDRAANGTCTTQGYAAGQVFYLYTPQVDHLSNDAENFGGMMTEVHVCTSVDPDTKKCTI